MVQSNQGDKEEACGTYGGVGDLRNPRRYEVGDTGGLTCLPRDRNAIAKTETNPLSSREDGDDQKRERQRC
ncbi:hypothetical protein F2Q70_00014270 [Brassica cretica]|uniref:Uncharacterized protein n=1 Tax=Brassica cretica TaxID=69181 RepID=A0A8S9HTN1_BRACR|nr:hypothetical protein F2Q70_00014270 [Brassica cretica]KAF2608754.1 hypothetical protein F2Q68_00043340 [Brassica cretica]